MADEQIRDLVEKDFTDLIKRNVADDMLCEWGRTSVLYHSMTFEGYTKWGCVRFKNRYVDDVSSFMLSSKNTTDAVFDIMAGLSVDKPQTVLIAKKMVPFLIVAKEVPAAVQNSYRWDIIKDFTAWQLEPTPYQRMLARKAVLQNERPLGLHDARYTAAAILNLDAVDFYKKMNILGEALRVNALALIKK